MQDNNLILNNPFGINISLPKKSVDEVKKVVKKEVGNISVNPFVDYLDDNDKVFSGEVAKEIKKYQAQIYSLGQIMREGQPNSSFNVNI